jgi:cytochrome c oxidase subunit 2
MLIPPDELGTPAMSDSPWALLPEASNHAAALDDLYIFITVLCVVSMVLVIGAQIYFMIKYRYRSDADRTSPITHSGKLEFWWSFIPTIFLIIVFVWGEIDFIKLSTPPSDAIDIRIKAQKWQWTIEYPTHHGGGAVHGGAPVLIVPLGLPVRLTMTSVDVLHAFYIPAFRVKKDIVPGRYSNLWFTAIQEGIFPVFCAEYCGDEHSGMLAKVIVVPADKYDQAVAEATKLEKGNDETMAGFGERVFKIKGCPACHTTDGSAKVGPSFLGVWGRTESLADGSTVVVDDNYVRLSLMEPNKQVVAGFAPQMPTFQGQITDDQVTALIEYFKTLK